MKEKYAPYFRSISKLSSCLLAVGILSACSSPAPWKFAEDCTHTLDAGSNDQVTVQTALIEAEDGGIVCMGPGTFAFETELSLAQDGLTLRGAGRSSTFLDFSAQDVGANGIQVTGDRVTITDLTVQETPGDGIRASDVADISFINVATVWTADSSLDNGAYGLYPVGSNGVLIDGCLAVGARDAGIYVGQSTNILVRNSEARGNVAGIEIENSTDAEVTGCYVHDNAAGILVFNLPDLNVQDGKRAKVHNNRVIKNNRANFAEMGTVVAMVPAGSGVLLLASDNNEFHNNEIRGNITMGVGVVSYNQALFGMTEDMEFDKYAQSNWFHTNTFSNNGEDGQDILAGNGADVVYDGCYDASLDLSEKTNCFSDHAGELTFFNVGLCEEGKALTLDDLSCEGSALTGQNP